MERMLEEIKEALKETYLDIANNYDASDLHHGGDIVACTASKFRHMAVEKIESIVRSYMKSEEQDGAPEIEEGYCMVDEVLCEIRDDVTREELQNIITEIKVYFCEHLPQYEVVKVRRKSFHRDDKYLYMVAAKKKSAESWAVWTGWNANTNSLNYGHYDLPNLEVCDRIMDEFYNSEE